MMRLRIGYVCGGVAVALVFLAILLATHANLSAGLVSLALAFALLLASLALLRVRENRL